MRDKKDREAKRRRDEEAKIVQKQAQDEFVVFADPLRNFTVNFSCWSNNMFGIVQSLGSDVTFALNCSWTKAVGLQATGRKILIPCGSKDAWQEAVPSSGNGKIHL